MLKMLLLLYYFAVIIYIAVKLLRGKKQLLTRLLILIFCPFISIVLLLAMDKKVKEYGETPFEASMEFIVKENREREVYFEEKRMDIVPVSDALMLSDNQTKRQMLIKLLKDYSIEHISILKAALENEDSETSHYAATAIQEMKRKLVNSLQSLEYELQQHPDDASILTAYCVALNEYIKSGFFDDRISKKYMFDYVHALDRLIQLQPDEAEHFKNKIETLLLVNEYDQALDTAIKFVHACPDHEEAYFLQMKIYFILHDHLRFKDVIASIKNSSVRLSPEGLIKLRFWLNEVDA